MLLELILSQIYAWNRGDLKEFLSYYHEDVKVYSKPADDLVFASKAAILPHIHPDFEAGTVERVKVIDQIESAPYVLLLEEKTSGKGSRRAIVTYLVEGNKIKCMWIERVENSVIQIPKTSLNNPGKCSKALRG
jgi:hypothetical protein